MRKADISLIVVIFLAFGIILAAVVITWGINKFTEMVNGKCWADMDKAMSQVKSDFGSPSNLPKTEKIPMGDCVGGVYMFNRAGASDVPLQDIVNEYCLSKSDSYHSFILVLPWKTLKADASKDQSWWASVKEKFTWSYYSNMYKETAQTVRRLKPSCIGLDGEFSQTYYIPQDLAKSPQYLNEKDLAMCYTLSSTSAPESNTNKLGYTYNLAFVNTLAKPADECVLK